MQRKRYEHQFNGKKLCVSPVDYKIGQVYKETDYFMFLRRIGLIKNG
jgi:hypothetical protein